MESRPRFDEAGPEIVAGAAIAGVRPEILVIGLGNPILGDDGVGWSIAELLSADAIADQRVEVDCLSVGGLSLMERMLGYRHVILVDAIETGRCPEGTVQTFGLDDLSATDLGHSASAHDASLQTALATARVMGGAVPEQVDIVAVEVKIGLEFTESLTPAVEAAVAVAWGKVMDLINS